MKVRLSLDTDNAAFEDDRWESEVARILRATAVKVEAGGTGFIVRDANGNKVGKFEVFA